ncbi:efflux RND transporter periplasmic adaptor subunit [Roseococcus sp. SYP-B2431]|uniref:efflux RND transporter periplasmic adaptor subunit n=1 Tax=Roseococcus sp. SYP-B2431 TaxID=2496640 RepID=UPI00103B3D57|nr:efflux RND transporter periplasmic adaptor subunit [Roseococcus sp. SYP-B2431]TCH98203.1 efflux RND transporter periplasmic adaptor subunit [Roseococcus sp. SYP-B2431]
MPDTPLPIEPVKALPAPPVRPALPAPDHPEAGPPARPRRRWVGWLVWLLILGSAGGAAWYYWPQLSAKFSGQPAQQGPGGARGRFGGGAVPVTVAPATRKDLPVLLDALGTVQALNTITVRSQVDGILVEVAFTEGQEVRRGDVLARIDPRTYAAAVAQAEAKLAQDQAVLANSRLDLQRYVDLSRNNGASRQQLDTQRALVAQNEALVQADQAAVDTARIQLDYTTIRSPVDGRVGLRQVDQGNLVRSGDANGLVVVTQVDPISVLFTLPQQDLPRILTAMREGPVEVIVVAADGSTRATGTLLTPDNQVDQTTGTIKLKATFPNPERLLWPGAFVNVRMLAATIREALTIPLVAVQRGPDGTYAFVLKDDNTVEQRPITTGFINATDAVVTRGLQPDEKVVTSGALRLNAGAQVQVIEPVVPAYVAPTRGRRFPGGQAGQRPAAGGPPGQAGAGNPASGEARQGRRGDGTSGEGRQAPPQGGQRPAATTP